MDWIGNLFRIYKPGQGIWARGVAALGFLAMGVFGAVQTADWMVDYRHPWTLVVGNIKLPLYYGVGMYVPLGIFIVFATLTVVTCNTARAADLLIETEIEMRKVTWPTAREVAGATVVVIIVVIILALYLFGTDQVLQYTILKWLGFAPRM